MQESVRDSVRRHFASVQLTLLSIVVALILENLLSAYWERPQPFPSDALQWLFWLQAGLVLATSLSMWSSKPWSKWKALLTLGFAVAPIVA